MNRSILKTSISSFIALVLVYYSVAWAVLRCSHDEDFAHTEAAVSDASVHSTGLPYSERQGGAHLDCLGSDYHTETLGAFLGPLQERLLSTDIASRVTDLSIVHSGTENGNLWLRVLFDGFARAHSIGPPRYLSLSVLRI
jgi:hypothetical protein